MRALGNRKSSHSADLDVCAKDFADGGGVSERALRGVRRDPVEEFADLPEASLAEIILQQRLKADRGARAGAGRAAVHSKYGIHIGAQQPWKDRTLVPRGGAVGGAAGVLRLEGLVLQRQRPRPGRREQPLLENRQHARRLPPFEQVAGERNGENLVGPDGRVRGA